MPRPRFEKAPMELRSAILSAARREFARVGYEGASLNKILEAAGLSKGAFYYYFDDKADLAVTVILDLWGPFLDFPFEAEPDSVDGFWAEIASVQRRLVDSIESDPESLALVSKLGPALMAVPELAQKLAGLLGHVQQKMIAVWEKGQRLGAVRTDIPLATQLSILQGIKEGVSRTMMPRDRTLTPAELDAIVALQLELFRRVTAPAPNDPGPP
jgi:AcrR family transcriptional regulator